MQIYVSFLPPPGFVRRASSLALVVVSMLGCPAPSDKVASSAARGDAASGDAASAPAAFASAPASAPPAVSATNPHDARDAGGPPADDDGRLGAPLTPPASARRCFTAEWMESDIPIRYEVWLDDADRPAFVTQLSVESGAAPQASLSWKYEARGALVGLEAAGRDGRVSGVASFAYGAHGELVRVRTARRGSDGAVTRADETFTWSGTFSSVAAPVVNPRAVPIVVMEFHSWPAPLVAGSLLNDAPGFSGKVEGTSGDSWSFDASGRPFERRVPHANGYIARLRETTVSGATKRTSSGNDGAEESQTFKNGVLVERVRGLTPVRETFRYDASGMWTGTTSSDPHGKYVAHPTCTRHP